MAEGKLFHMAVASLVFALLGLVFSFISYVSLIVGIYAIVKIRHHPELKGMYLAIAGMAIAAIFIVLDIALPFWRLSLLGSVI